MRPDVTKREHENIETKRAKNRALQDFQKGSVC